MILVICDKQKKPQHLSWGCFFVADMNVSCICLSGVHSGVRRRVFLSVQECLSEFGNFMAKW